MSANGNPPEYYNLPNQEIQTMSSAVPEVKPCKTHGMYGGCPGHPGPYDTPEPELNVEAELDPVEKFTEDLMDNIDPKSLLGILRPVIEGRGDVGYKVLTDLEVLIQQVSDQRVREFSEKLKSTLPPDTNWHEGMTGSDTVKELTMDLRGVREAIDQTLVDYLSHKEQSHEQN